MRRAPGSGHAAPNLRVGHARSSSRLLYGASVMGIRVGSRFADRRYPDEERVCPVCALPKLHQKVRESQIGILAGMPLFVYRDKLVVDCNHCRTKTETNVPLSLGSRPFSERFGLVMAVGVVSMLYGVYAALGGGFDAIGRRSRTADEK